MLPFAPVFAGDSRWHRGPPNAEPSEMHKPFAQTGRLAIPRLQCWLYAWLSVAALLAGSRCTLAAVRDPFEGPDVSLFDDGGDAHYRIEAHARVSHGAHSGQWCEHVTVSGSNGTYIHMAHTLAPARVIGELVPTVWVKSDRPGLQLIVRVVLPRSIDPRSGRPLTTLVRGTSYAKVDAWEQLRLDNLVPQLKSQVRVLRAEIGRNVDEREAYVDRILINVYGGPGLTNVNIDDLEVAGAVPPQTAMVSATSEVPSAAPVAHSQSLPVAWAGGKSVPKIERSGSILIVGNEPFFPRAIEYQGEAPRGWWSWASTPPG